ncbi:hypothetical protein CBS101457_002720 [Exobasidium rhododendri]|nr:hypothetical protein CBS101457_002720 [Exobasidium rhododendri]
MAGNYGDGSASPVLSKIKETPFPPPTPQRKRHREAQIATAYDLQRFRSQTLALKAFIVSGFTIFGFVVGADTVLLNHEGVQRTEEDLIRTVARRELAKKGIIGSESEIEKWKDQTRERLLREREATVGQEEEPATLN